MRKFLFSARKAAPPNFIYIIQTNLSPPFPSCLRCNGARVAMSLLCCRRVQPGWKDLLHRRLERPSGHQAVRPVRPRHQRLAQNGTAAHGSLPGRRLLVRQQNLRCRRLRRLELPQFRRDVRPIHRLVELHQEHDHCTPWMRTCCLQRYN